MPWFALAVTLLWLIAVFWFICGVTALRGLRHVPDLWITAPLSDDDRAAQITVIIPARNEASAIEATLRSLLTQSISVEIIAVDDRSTDATGAIMDRIAAEPHPPGKTLRILHVKALPEGWLGKPHAMAFAARHATALWLLFTDADVLFAPDVLARALRFAAESQADHLVLMPTLILKSSGERSMASFFQAMSLLWWRPWRIADARTRDSIGIGAFNLIRADVYRAVGGFEAQRFQILDDVRLGVEVKRGGYRQRMVFGRELIRLHWASGALGMARNLTKNLFAGFAFNAALLLGACLGLALICYAPLASLFFSWPLRIPALLSVAMIALHYRLAGRYFSGLRLYWAFTLPIAAVLVLYAMLRSMVVTLTRRGIVWRGTFYPLKDLRRHSGRLR
jgi:glycosyltransferase involved in cell wall biosynthesis